MFAAPPAAASQAFPTCRDAAAARSGLLRRACSPNAGRVNSPTFLSASLLVALGGGIGAWLRYVAGLAFVGAGISSRFPWATLSVNVAGSLAMGLLAGWLIRHGAQGEGWRLLLGVGLLGGFTTFSAISLELATMIQRGLLASAFAYAALSMLAALAALFAGLAMTRVVA